ncbi:unnamed protein product [Parajaminaea phylloscopi]
MSALTLTSALLGWLYTFLWSLSFWPQFLNNWRRQSVEGFSKDFAHLNVLGFASYAAYNLAFLTNETVQEQYRQRHHGFSNAARWNDAAFAVHAAIMSLLQVAQCWWYHAQPASGPRRPFLSRFAVVSLSVLSIVIAAASLLAWVSADAKSPGWLRLQWLDVVNILSWVKLYITLVKYFPQINLNRKRRSTRGFSVESFLLDFSGGVLSLLQLLLDAGLINHDWSAVTGDFGKLGLSLLSLSFDLVLITQHYILYGDVSPEEHREPEVSDDHTDPERRPLIPDATARSQVD